MKDTRAKHQTNISAVSHSVRKLANHNRECLNRDLKVTSSKNILFNYKVENRNGKCKLCIMVQESLTHFGISIALWMCVLRQNSPTSLTHWTHRPPADVSITGSQHLNRFISSLYSSSDVTKSSFCVLTLPWWTRRIQNLQSGSLVLRMENVTWSASLWSCC